MRETSLAVSLLAAVLAITSPSRAETVVAMVGALSDEFEPFGGYTLMNEGAAVEVCAEAA